MVPTSSQEDESPFECSLIEWPLIECPLATHRMPTHGPLIEWPLIECPLIEWPLIEWWLIQGKTGKGTAISEVENMGLQQVPEKKPHILTL